MWSAIASILLGVIGWGATHFFGGPLVDFMNLRKQVHEEIVFTGNIGAIVADTPAYGEAVNSLRRLGAKVQAIAATDSRLLRWYLAYRGYDLRKAGGGLIGLSNSLHSQDAGRAVQTNWVQVGLKLPRDYDDEMLRAIDRRTHSRDL